MNFDVRVGVREDTLGYCTCCAEVPEEEEEVVGVSTTVPMLQSSRCSLLRRRMAPTEGEGVGVGVMEGVGVCEEEGGVYATPASPALSL